MAIWCSALVLSLGIAIQNFPEGAIISMPLRAEGESKGKAFLGGVLSGVVEPVGAVLTMLYPKLVWRRTKTQRRGDDRCDFCMKTVRKERSPKNEA